MNSNSKTWLAAHLYYSEPWTDLLVKAVYPFVKQVLKEGLAEHYFFIRYWERGPHIRLRFWGDRELMEERLKPRIDDHFGTYFRENPSEREEPAWSINAEDDRKWLPDNTVQYIGYEPEKERYGGEKALVVGEKHFESSSNTVLDIMSENDDWGYERALGAAIQLHLGFAYALGMDLYETSHFFSRVYQSWLPRAYYFFESDISKEELEERRQKTLEAFEQNFREQKDQLVAYVNMVWEAFEEEKDFEQEWLNTWLEETKNIGEDLKKLQEDQSLIVPDRHFSEDPTDIPADRVQLWNIYDSYVHMTNNRLSIMNRDEGYLGYLIRETLRHLLGTVHK